MKAENAKRQIYATTKTLEEWGILEKMTVSQQELLAHNLRLIATSAVTDFKSAIVDDYRDINNELQSE